MTKSLSEEAVAKVETLAAKELGQKNEIPSEKFLCPNSSAAEAIAKPGSAFGLYG